MLENILAWVMVALAIPALLAGAVVLVALFALAALLIIPCVFLLTFNYIKLWISTMHLWAFLCLQ